MSASSTKTSHASAAASEVRALCHPLIQHHLTRLRDRGTPAAEFRTLIRRLSGLLCYEATADLATVPCVVRTPVAEHTGVALRGRVGLIPILRAGVGMVEAVLDFLPDAEVWHLGFYRDETTLRPVGYYSKLPANRPVDVAMILDPMLATGGSAIAALEAVRDWGVPTVKLVAVIAAPEGIAAVQSKFPHVRIHVAAIDSRLNDHGYIVPGLGDAGDRIFNTSVTA